MSLQTDFIDALDGHRIPVRLLAAGAPERALVVIAHGMAEHGGRYAPLAEFLAARGCHVCIIDHRGHGLAATRPEEIGHFADPAAGIDGWQRVVDDLHRVIGHQRARHPTLPLLLLGHSMGSFISQALAIAHGRDIDALILSGSACNTAMTCRGGRLIARFERWRQGERGRSALMEKLSFGAFNKAFTPTRTEYDWLSRDPAVVDRYVADPLCGFRVTNQLWMDLLGGLVMIAQTENLARIPHNLPVYIFGGDRDPVGHDGKGLPKLEQRLREAGLRNVTTKLYRDGRHEMLNEINRDEVFADLAGWIEKTTG